MNIDYFSSIYGAIYGGLLGILLLFLGFKAERYLTQKTAKRELIRSLRFNRERADQIFQQFAANITPNYTFDTTGFIIWTNACAGILDDSLIDRLNWHRYKWITRT